MPAAFSILNLKLEESYLESTLFLLRSTVVLQAMTLKIYAGAPC